MKNFYSNLIKYGLTSQIITQAEAFEEFHIARVSEQHRNIYKVISEQGELSATISGKFAFEAQSQLDYPAVGDWVMIDRADDEAGNAIIHSVLQRKSLFTRQAAGTSNDLQVIASNIDIVFICMSLNADFNLRRVERYLAIAWDSMATPVIVLTKSDLCSDLEEKLFELSSVSIGVEVVVTSAEDALNSAHESDHSYNEHSGQESGYEGVEKYIKEGCTIVFIGSSGVGKSTLINRLFGEEVLKTNEIRGDDDKGRHTTTHRQLLLLPNGGVVIDTPGMREIQIGVGDLSKTFEDIEELIDACKYSDCSHGNEPGCKVQEAISNGDLSQERFDSYQKLQREIAYSSMNSRQLENDKISRMFGSKSEMKQFMDEIKNKNK